MSESFDEQLSRFDLMCEGDPTFDLSENDIAALLAVRTELRIMARVNLELKRERDELKATIKVERVTSRIMGIQDATQAYSVETFATLEAELAEARNLVERYKSAVSWALGSNGDFAARKEGEGAYWWRRELMRRIAPPSPEATQEPSDTNLSI